jgi:alkylation response protein AidB-like acyl-CoA dehydrogenase
MGIVIPEEYGGSGLGYHEYVAILDEISQVDPSIGLSVAAHNSLCTNHIYEFGNEEQEKNGFLNCFRKSNRSLGTYEHNTGSDSAECLLLL